jgi:hypothetical protein
MVMAPGKLFEIIKKLKNVKNVDKTTGKSVERP